MQKLEKICPNCMFNCIRVVIVSINKRIGKKQKSYQGMNQFEEEQFSISFNSLNSGQSTQDNSRKYSIQNQQIINHKQFNRLSIQNSQKTASIDFETSEQFKSQNQEHTKLMIPVNYGEFKINLQPYDPYYELIANKTANAQQLFQDTHYQLIDLRDINKEAKQDNKVNFEVRSFPKQIGFKFIFKYELPCSYSFLLKTNRQSEAVLLFSDKIKDYSLVQTVRPNLQIMNLEFKKIMGLGLQPRRFNYLKYINQCDEKHWETCISIDYKKEQDFNPLNKNSVQTAELFSLSHIIEDTQSNGDKKMFIQTYIEINLHSMIRAKKFIHKGLKQVLAYIEKLHNYAQENYREQNQIV